jgi:hypothetical protein
MSFILLSIWQKKQESNEVMHDYEFHLQMLVEQKQMDFENFPDQ